MISIIQREWLRLKKQPKLAAATFLIPCAFVFLVMGIFFSGILEKAPQKIAVVTDSAQVKKFVEEQESYRDILVFDEMDEELRAMYDKGEAAVILEVREGEKTVGLKYDSTKISSGRQLLRGQDFVRELALFMQEEGLYEAFKKDQGVILKQDISAASDREKAQLLLYISVFAGVLIFMTGQPLVSFAMDACVGEQERGTYDSIRLSGVGIYRFVLGKTLFTVTAGIILGLLLTATALSVKILRISLWFLSLKAPTFL